MEITELVEKNTTLLRLGLHLEFNDCRHRVASHLQRNIDRSKYGSLDSFCITIFFFFNLILILLSAINSILLLLLLFIGITYGDNVMKKK